MEPYDEWAAVIQAYNKRRIALDWNAPPAGRTTTISPTIRDCGR
jgi:FKBP-type peptidyl-prolyl cis-trans isomerase 2